MTTHDLKIWPEFFDAILHDRKRFELRLDDRIFHKDDLLRLREWLPHAKKYTGRKLMARVTYVLRYDPKYDFGLRPGFAILGLAETVQIQSTEDT